MAPVSKVSKTGSKEKEDIRRFPLSQYDLPFDIMTVGCEYTEKVLFFIRLNFPPPLPPPSFAVSYQDRWKRRATLI